MPPTSDADTRPTSNTAVKSWDEKPVSPWRRYGARILDSVTSGTAAFIIIALAWYQLAPLSADAFFSMLDTRAGRFLDLFVTLIAAGIVNAIVLASTGSTFGKLIFGIKVARLDGSPLNLVESFQREIKVWMVGLGLGIPLISLITMLMSYKALTKDGHASWDAGKHQVLYRQSSGQVALNVLGIVLIVAARLATSALAKLQ